MDHLNSKLAIDGGMPVRERMLPYGRQHLDEDDIQAVVEVLRSDWLTTGPAVAEFENSFSRSVNANESVAVSNGTAALHAAMHAIGIGVGDEVIIPAISFVATANCVLYTGGTPVFSDVQSDTLLIDPLKIEANITSRTKAIIAMDYAGHPCNYDALRAVADKYGLYLVADACHSLGSSFKGRLVGSLADLNIFSFHPVKAITTGEGGMITTNDKELSRKMRIFRNHGITTDHLQRAKQGSFLYEMHTVGYNYRLSDIQCALGVSQLQKLSKFVKRRREIASIYDNALRDYPVISPLSVRDHVLHSYHLYAVKVQLDQIGMNREQIFSALRAENIGVNVHYMPVYRHPLYKLVGTNENNRCLTAESVYEQLLSLPIFPDMTNEDVSHVVDAIEKLHN